MRGGTLWRSMARAVGAVAPTVAVTTSAAHCVACSAAPMASARVLAASCSCKTTAVVPAPKAESSSARSSISVGSSLLARTKL
jgi:hypothetical protein